MSEKNALRSMILDDCQKERDFKDLTVEGWDQPVRLLEMDGGQLARYDDFCQRWIEASERAEKELRGSGEDTANGTVGTHTAAVVACSLVCPESNELLFPSEADIVQLSKSNGGVIREISYMALTLSRISSACLAELAKNSGSNLGDVSG